MRNIRLFQKIVIPCINVAFRLFYRVNVYGRENIPDGPCVVCSNHSQLTDPFFLLVAMQAKNDIASMAKKELFENSFVGWFVTGLGAFPVDRSISDITAIKTAIKSLKDGRKLAIFPEGSRSANGEVKDGAAMIAIKTNNSILPIFITRDKKFMSKVNIVIGKPFNVEKDDSGYSNASKEIIRRIYKLEK